MGIAEKKYIIWRFIDGKPGHENQTLGLVQALGRILPVEKHDLPTLTFGQSFGLFARLRRLQQLENLPAPDLIVAAGSATHLAMLAAKCVYGGKTVVLMRPNQIYRCFFDLCLIPVHDGVSQSNKIIQTKGVLNTIVADKEKTSTAGLMLIGGESRHFHWDVDAIVKQVSQVAKSTPQIDWLLTTSRRTSKKTINVLEQIRMQNLKIVNATNPDATWLPNKLASATQVWVSPDSVNMLSEALTSGASVGLFDLQSKNSGRILAFNQLMIKEGNLTTYNDWLTRQALKPPIEQFNEAARCADQIKQRWFSEC